MCLAQTTSSSGLSNWIVRPASEYIRGSCFLLLGDDKRPVNFCGENILSSINLML